MKRYAFTFDSSACTGCKACQAACKDKHNLPVGVLWRRVYEVSGGGWTHCDQAWQSSVFAYSLSLACNHCERPICLEVCPAGAYSRREDGIVLLDSTRCLGCRYCVWACPYGAPQYDPRAGVTSKCSFCFDLLERGLPPACVAACPMRALDFVETAELKGGSPAVRSVFPLPDPNLTSPALFITPHPAVSHIDQGQAQVRNWEEVSGQPDE